MPSSKPNGSYVLQFGRRQAIDAQSKPRRSCASIACSNAARAARAGHRAARRTCGSRSPTPHSQLRGSFAATSPRRRARLASLAMPFDKLVRESLARCRARPPRHADPRWSTRPAARSWAADRRRRLSSPSRRQPGARGIAILTRSRRKLASVRCPSPNRTRPCMSSNSDVPALAQVCALIAASTRRAPARRSSSSQLQPFP